MAFHPLCFLFVLALAGGLAIAQQGGQGFNTGGQTTDGQPDRPGGNGGGRPPFDGQPGRPGGNGGGRPPGMAWADGADWKLPVTKYCKIDR